MLNPAPFIVAPPHRLRNVLCVTKRNGACRAIVGARCFVQQSRKVLDTDCLAGKIASMNKKPAAPTNLRDAMHFFADEDFAHEFFVELRWPKGVRCPACDAEKPSYIKTRRIWQCRDCGRQFSAKLGTIFEDSPLGLNKWLPALWMLTNCKNGISSYELARALGITQKSAWFMLGRIRMAMRTRTFKRFGGEVEVDETFVGGLAKFMHKSRRERVIKGTGGMNKTKVVGILQREGGGRRGPSRIRAQRRTRRDHEPLAAARPSERAAGCDGLHRCRLAVRSAGRRPPAQGH